MRCAARLIYLVFCYFLLPAFSEIMRTALQLHWLECCILPTIKCCYCLNQKKHQCVRTDPDEQEVITRQPHSRGPLCYYADQRSLHQLETCASHCHEWRRATTPRWETFFLIGGERHARVLVSLRARMFLTRRVFPALGDALLMAF